MNVARLLAVAGAMVMATGALVAQQGMPVPLDPNDSTGFRSIFDGTSLEGWDGDPAVWRVENGAIIGESTAERPLERNTFLIWRGGQPRDFELRLRFRMNATNSGIQYRSVEVPEVGRWVLRGYQADIDFDNRYTGQLYEERGRGFLALRGQSTWVPPDGRPVVIGSVGDPEALKAHIRVNDWNDLHLVARGNVLIHVINGHVMAVAVDDGPPAGADAGGLIGVQIHTGPPMRIELKDVWLRTHGE